MKHLANEILPKFPWFDLLESFALAFVFCFHLVFVCVLSHYFAPISVKNIYPYAFDAGAVVVLVARSSNSNSNFILSCWQCSCFSSLCGFSFFRS